MADSPRLGGAERGLFATMDINKGDASPCTPRSITAMITALPRNTASQH